VIVVVLLDIETLVSVKVKVKSAYVKESTEAVQEIEVQSILQMYPFAKTVSFWKRRRRR
jgi:hypothetical protein